MPTKPFDRYTMSPTQEPEPPLCADCGEPAPRFYHGFYNDLPCCRGCERKHLSRPAKEVPTTTWAQAIRRLVELDEEKEEHLEQYISGLMKLKYANQYPYIYERIARELRLINAGVSPDDIRHGTYPNLSEFEIEPSGD